MLGYNWDLGFLRVFLCTIVFSLIIVKSLQLRGRRQIAEPRKFCLVRVIVFFDVCFLYLFCFSQVGILGKIPYRRLMDHSLTGEEHMYSPQKCYMSKCKAFQKSDAGTVRSSLSTEILKETDSFYPLTIR